MSETITLEYEVSIDQDRIVDGRLHAASLIHQAYRLLMPYVGDCPGCTDQLFETIANRTIAKLHADGAGGVLLHLGAPEQRVIAQQAHLEREQAGTSALLARDTTCH